MTTLRWTAIIMLLMLALAAALAAFSVLSGLPADVAVPLGPQTLHWTPSRNGNLVASFGVFAAIFAGAVLIYVIAAKVWDGLGQLADFCVDLLRNPEAVAVPPWRAGIQILLALIVATSLFSSLVRSPFAVVAIIIACLGLACIVLFQRAFYWLRSDELTVRSRASAIGGGQSEWRISPPLILALMAIALAVGTVGLAGVTFRAAAPPPAAQEARPPSKEPSKESGKSSETASSAGPSETPYKSQGGR